MRHKHNSFSVAAKSVTEHTVEVTQGSKERQTKKLTCQTTSEIQHKDSKIIVKPKATKAMRLKQIQIKFDNLYSPSTMNFKNEFKYETNMPKPRIEHIINKGATP
jgi:hypothetical protein